MRRPPASSAIVVAVFCAAWAVPQPPTMPAGPFPAIAAENAGPAFGGRGWLEELLGEGRGMDGTAWKGGRGNNNGNHNAGNNNGNRNDGNDRGNAGSGDGHGNGNGWRAR